jgi:hypothetical protein
MNLAVIKWLISQTVTFSRSVFQSSAVTTMTPLCLERWEIVDRLAKSHHPCGWRVRTLRR